MNFQDQWFSNFHHEPLEPLNESEGKNNIPSHSSDVRLYVDPLINLLCSGQLPVINCKFLDKMLTSTKPKLKAFFTFTYFILIFLGTQKYQGDILTIKQSVITSSKLHCCSTYYCDKVIYKRAGEGQLRGHSKIA